jgi:putative transposase
MANHFKVEIRESLDTLKHLLKSQTSAQGKERLQMLYWLKSGQLTTRQDLAHRLDRDESTIYRWLQRYRQGGLESLIAVKRAQGQPPKIRGAALALLQEQLAHPEGFTSYGAIQDWLAQTCGLEIPYSTVYRTVRSRLKAKLKVPRPRSHAVDEQQQQAYKKTCQR